MAEQIGRQIWLAMDIMDTSVQQEIAYYQTQAKQYLPNAEWEDPTQFHITLDFIAENEINYQPIVEALKEFQQADLIIHNSYIFGHNFYSFAEEGNEVLWMGIDYSWHLYKIKYAVQYYLQKHGITSANSHPTYTPHITMAYKAPTIPPIQTPRIAIPLNNITLWNSFKVNDTYVDNILYQIKL